jgi:hypothetical protein
VRPWVNASDHDQTLNPDDHPDQYAVAEAVRAFAGTDDLDRLWWVFYDVSGRPANLAGFPYDIKWFLFRLYGWTTDERMGTPPNEEEWGWWGRAATGAPRRPAERPPAGPCLRAGPVCAVREMRMGTTAMRESRPSEAPDRWHRSCSSSSAQAGQVTPPVRDARHPTRTCALPLRCRRAGLHRLPRRPTGAAPVGSGQAVGGADRACRPNVGGSPMGDRCVLATRHWASRWSSTWVARNLASTGCP